MITFPKDQLMPPDAVNQLLLEAIQSGKSLSVALAGDGEAISTMRLLAQWRASELFDVDPIKAAKQRLVPSRDALHQRLQNEGGFKTTSRLPGKAGQEVFLFDGVEVSSLILPTGVRVDISRPFGQPDSVFAHAGARTRPPYLVYAREIIIRSEAEVDGVMPDILAIIRHAKGVQPMDPLPESFTE